VTKRNSSPGRARHKPSTHCAGKAECSASPVCCCAVFCVCFCAADRGCQPAPGLPCALFTEEGDGKGQSSGVSGRENADLCVIEPREWCCQTGLNCRPLHYQWSALPLSYGSMCWDENRPPRGAYQAGRYLPQAPLLCKLASSARTRKSGRYRGQNARFHGKVPTFRRFRCQYPRPTGQLAAAWHSAHFGLSHEQIVRAS
jgi:hypothetical protein